MSTNHFAIVKAPGHRDHEMTIISAHATAEAAKRRAGSDKSLSIVKSAQPVAKGGRLWDDALGRAGWDAV